MSLKNKSKNGMVNTQMGLLNHGSKIQKDQSQRKLVSCGYQMKEEKSNQIKNAKEGENLRTLTTTTTNVYI